MSAIIWFYGLSGSGKTTAAKILHKQLLSSGRSSVLLDADNLRKTFWPELGYDKHDRDENTKRITLLAKEFYTNDIHVIVASIAARKDQRIYTSGVLPNTKFIFVNTPVEVCASRKPQFYDASDANNFLPVDPDPPPWAVLDGTQSVIELYKYVDKLKDSII